MKIEIPHIHRRMIAMAAFVCLLSNLSISNAAEATKEKKALKVGDVAPEFVLKGSDGKTYKLSDFKGKSAVVVAWYPKALTGG